MCASDSKGYSPNFTGANLLFCIPDPDGKVSRRISMSETPTPHPSSFGAYQRENAKGKEETR